MLKYIHLFATKKKKKKKKAAQSRKKYQQRHDIHIGSQACQITYIYIYI